MNVPSYRDLSVRADNVGVAASGGALGRLCLLGIAALMLGACALMTDESPRARTERYEQVVANPIRGEQDRTMDAGRHPVELLTFAQVRPGMRVLDVSAGAGYTSQLLALSVGDKGMLFAQSPKPGERLTKRLVDHPQSNFVIVARPFEDPVAAEAGGLDLITIILNYHDITYLPVDRAKMDARLFAALKPGGHLVVVDHSARKGTGIADGKTLHRIDEAVVLDELKQAGFVLEAESDFLRNPADARDQVSAGGAIVSDKFALRFVKP
jgi:predicted methyltransferase